jgi:hypothetical protein
MKRGICYSIIMILSFILASSYAAAMGGGHGGGMGGGNVGGGMGYGGGAGGGYMDGGMGSGGGYGHHDFGRQPSYGNRSPMTRGTAENLARDYMSGRYSGGYRMGDMKDNGTYYSTEIRGPKGAMTERVLIDKQTGNIHSLQR